MDVLDAAAAGSKLASCRRVRRPRNPRMAHVRARRLTRTMANLLVTRCSADVMATDLSTDPTLAPWTPRHTVTRRTAQLSREVYSAWKCHVGTSPFISAEKVRKLFNDLELFPSDSDVGEMLECAKECGGRTDPSYLTFREFYIFANELKKWHDRGLHKPNQLPRLLEKDGADLPRRTRNMSGCGNCEVFLGGSCNPTTWRVDVAIPLLQKMNITFYNPQVAHWRPELLEMEYRAKERASVLFFVLDNQTRSVSALIEVAEIAGRRRKLVLVVQSYTQQHQSICGEPVSQSEYEDLREGQLVLQRLVERQGIPVFDNIAVALRCTERVLRENLTVEQVGARVSRTDPSPFLMKMREVFDTLDKDGRGWISDDDARLGASGLLGHAVSFADMETALPHLAVGRTENESNISWRIDLDQFCTLVSEVKTSQERGAVSGSRRLASDVYLGGSHKDSTWMDAVAIPILKKQNVSWFDPRQCKEDESATAAALEDSSVLLFIITDACRCIAAMAVAGHYIGRGRKMVLCVKQLPENACIGGETLTPIAIKDYNRGRMYLADLAQRAGIPVFSSIPEAVACAATTANSQHARTF